ncbi:rhomboid family intramembrane serine protease [Candidatus Oleimmundimicrobium sp.]|uniref:rhomboid family intramembrane serine protease n=1 Tax=Candidatus Oleimmundimicrobium sp. TaxID=3060597 RepID=UPI002717A98A|nr:rhomboid family intramembrane serine protease [Candidatus Oleimmundimicrobium sp.]MDO8885691.1 rhomboid family intramembrane serine protease [Candidatus Oleimmundimicrobium sp.]
MIIPIHDDNPTQTISWATMSLIIINVTIFIYELSLGSGLDMFIKEYAMTPYLIVQFPSISTYLTLITSIFLHGGWIHVIGNMLYLWIFGNNIEDVLGHGKFLVFYFLCGLGGAIGHIIFNPTSTIPSLGASGAIAGVLAAYLILYPLATIDVAIPIFIFIKIIRLPAIIVIGFWFFLQLTSGYAAITTPVMQSSGGVAWFAHIGGFMTGLLLILIFPKKRNPRVRHRKDRY